MEITIREPLESELYPVARLIADQNSTPATQCLHSDEIVETAYSRIRAIAEERDGAILAAVRDEIVGACACEFDLDAGRAWLWGPFAADRDWKEVSEVLMSSLESRLPPAITRMDSFPNLLNQRAVEFYRGLGFSEGEKHHVYVAERRATSSPTSVSLLLDEYLSEAGALHESLFPDSYLTGDGLAEKRSGPNRVFVETNGGAVLGYIVAECFEEDGEGYVHFIGVGPEARRAGVGRRLLEAALAWLFEEKGAPRTSLVVRGELTGAQALYEGAGFALKYTGLAMRRDRR